MVVGGAYKGLEMVLNAAGLDVSGSKNPRWLGGSIEKTCCVCSKAYTVKRSQHKSRYCSLKCVGVSQRGIQKKENLRREFIECAICYVEFSVFSSHASRYHCCSKECSHQRRAKIMRGDGNPNWNGGLSRLPYPFNFNAISRSIIERDGYQCQNPDCSGKDSRLTTHHINYIKSDCREENLIALCSSCNTKANFGREGWSVFYQSIIVTKKVGGFAVEEF